MPRWIQCLYKNNCISEHRQDQEHNNADALSWRPCRKECVHCQKFNTCAEVKQTGAIVGVATDGWDSAAIQKATQQ
jgi:hypothetical protein